MAFSWLERYAKGKSNENGAPPNDSYTAKREPSPTSEYNFTPSSLSTCNQYINQFLCLQQCKMNWFWLPMQLNSIALHQINVTGRFLAWFFYLLREIFHRQFLVLQLIASNSKQVVRIKSIEEIDQ